MKRTRVTQAKASWAPGALYAVDGGEGWFYYGQVSACKPFIGFPHYRTARIEPDKKSVLSNSLMARVCVHAPSLGRALRSGQWHLIGKAPLHPDFGKPYGRVLCPVGTNKVQAWVYRDMPGAPGTNIKTWDTKIDDPEIQGFEVWSIWDAEDHIPRRLKADFGAEEADWDVTGPVWRHRNALLERARRFPDAPGSQRSTD